MTGRLLATAATALALAAACSADARRQARAVTIPPVPRSSLHGRIAYSTRGGDIWVMNANGTGKRRLMDDTAVDRQPSWSPDGSLVTFVSDRIDNPSGPDADIFTVPAAGGAMS